MTQLDSLNEWKFDRNSFHPCRGEFITGIPALSIISGPKARAGNNIVRNELSLTGTESQQDLRKPELNSQLFPKLGSDIRPTTCFSFIVTMADYQNNGNFVAYICLLGNEENTIN